jgi:hypothetical protein
MMRVAGLSAALLLLPLAALAAEPARPGPLPLPRSSGPVVLDGELGEPAWRDAAVIDAFYETVFGDNREPLVRTVALVTYDARYFYVGLRCQDDDPRQIRAPYAERDEVLGNQDNVAIFLDTRNDGRSAQEFRVNPRGIQADGVWTDATGNEDFAPDFYYDTAAQIGADGWQAELRIPLSSLRYPKSERQTWRILIWRNLPREFRYAIYSSPLPRGSNCLICHSQELTEIAGLPSGGHLVLAPYASAQDVATAPAPGEPLAGEPADAELGLDLKWTPTPNTALDAALNPDFSQVEADVAQIAVNNRFALFFPEKRPFFLEGVDLFETPVQAVYTRTITSPRWGARSTGKLGSSSYTVLLAQDRGGGSVVLPGPSSSDLAPQDFRSFVGIARWRRDFGSSFVGLLATDREIEGGGHNRVGGPDFQWRPNERDRVTAQLLWSESRTPERPDLSPAWDGGSLDGHALEARWLRRTRTYDVFAEYEDVGAGFRADDGFVPQVGYREGSTEVGYAFYPSGLLSFARPYVFATYSVDREGSHLNQRVGPGVFVLGKRNLQGFVGMNFDRVLTGDKVLERRQLPFNLQFDPSHRFPRLALAGFLGEDVDLANVRVGTGGELTGTATLRPTDHLDTQLHGALSWLDVETPSGGSGRLFTARILRVRAIYNFSARLFLRLIGQYVTEERDPSLYVVPVAARSAFFSGSFLFSYRLNWQTALFLGYGDDRERSPADSLEPTGRQLFLKVSYAFRR